MMPQSLGVIGGKPNSAHYFIGYVGECSPQWCPSLPEAKKREWSLGAALWDSAAPFYLPLDPEVA